MQLPMAQATDARFVQAIPDVASLVRIAVALGATSQSGALSQAEGSTVEEAMAAPLPPDQIVNEVRRRIQTGEDPLGDALCRLRPASERRIAGAFYTPAIIVEPMVDWILKQDPMRVVDAGCGSGRFAVAVARRNRAVAIVAIDNDPVATLLTRAALAAVGASKANIINCDFTTIHLERIPGRTAFIGNPPYVRHHQLTREAKLWAAQAAEQLGHRASGLAGLHAHFFLATAVHAIPGDVGCYVTSSEWLDIGYGATIRELLRNGLGGRSLHLIAPEARPFEDAQTTAAIVCFAVGAAPVDFRVSYQDSFNGGIELGTGVAVPKETLARSERWSRLLLSSPEFGIRLGALVRVHRGIVTGSNNFFVMTKSRASELGVEPWCRPAITAAREIIEAEGVIRDGPQRKVVLDVAADIDRAEHPSVDAYLSIGETSNPGKQAVSERYVCAHRKPWWHLGKPAKPPVVASYMARQAPAFALNPDGLVLLNIGHGLHPREPMPDDLSLEKLVSYLNNNRQRFRGAGRTYQGGLEKFEPGEMEAFRIEWETDAA